MLEQEQKARIEAALANPLKLTGDLRIRHLVRETGICGIFSADTILQAQGVVELDERGAVVDQDKLLKAKVKITLADNLKPKHQNSIMVSGDTVLIDISGNQQQYRP